MGRALLVPAVLGCAACSAIAGLNKDYVVDESTTANADAGALDDGAVPSPDGEAGSVDAAIDAPRLPFCDGGAIFCTDFEGDAGLIPPWTRRENSGGEPTLAGDIGVDGSRALLATMTATGNATAATVVWRTVAVGFPVASTLTLSFRFNVRQKTTNYAALGVIQFGGIEHGLAMYDPSKCAGAPCLDENDQSGPGNRGHDATDSLLLELGAWHTGVVSLTHASAGYAGKVIVDGHVVDDRASGAMPANASTSLVEVGVGSFFSSGAGTNEVVIDDVVVTNQAP